MGRLQIGLAWWQQSLWGLLPVAWAKRLRAPRNYLLLLKLADSQIHVVRGEGVGQSHLRTVPLSPAAGDGLLDVMGLIGRSSRRMPIVLLLSTDQVLSQRITLPVAAEGSLNSFFEFDLDRLTPFASDEVYYDYQVIGRDKAKGRITVLLVLIRRQDLDGLLETLGALGSRLHSVDVTRNTNTDRLERHGVNLLPSELRHKPPSRPFWLSVAFATMALAFVVFLQMSTLNHKEGRIEKLQAQVRGLSESTKAVIELTKQVSETEQATHFVMARKLQIPTMTDVLRRLTEVLPDHTHIEQLRVNGNEVELHGFSKSAASLIPLLEGSPWFQEATLRAAITQDRESALERYKIRVAVDRKALRANSKQPAGESSQSGASEDSS
ncbi:Type IV pilus assembly protein PilM [Marinobacter gudaonensis]|uniref:Type IV pilus assembly protein PilM n=1 Tax=Marinobacter gudaonensis TaxID=375760 RepID=A0A1I6HZR8_9GAMM|nr:PilN domain-containing protein [Marinobacter gudaonensis]SFR59908.1 Type IV pilus assembly protein PilM [Marinobacter gudaonensis]